MRSGRRDRATAIALVSLRSDLRDPRAQPLEIMVVDEWLPEIALRALALRAWDLRAHSRTVS